MATRELAWVRMRAKRGGVSVSSVISAAVRRERQQEARLRLLEKLEVPELTAADLEEIRREWRG